MLGCPIKLSKEWIDVLERANGNEAEAMKEWSARYGLNEKLNYIPDVELDIEEKKMIYLLWWIKSEYI